MGSSCSQPAAPLQPAQEILVLVEQVTMMNTRSNTEVRALKRLLGRNSADLKRRIRSYEEKLKGMDKESPAAKIYAAEKLRTEELLKALLRMQTPLAYMA
jgi:hypothetical protein